MSPVPIETSKGSRQRIDSEGYRAAIANRKSENIARESSTRDIRKDVLEGRLARYGQNPLLAIHFIDTVSLPWAQKAAVASAEGVAAEDPLVEAWEW